MTVRYGICAANAGEFGDPRALVALGEAAERAGWDAFFINDHVLYHHRDWPVANPTVVLGALAARTSRIRLGTLMTALPRRRPQVVAREVATLAALAGADRVIFGAGLGSMDAEYAAFGEDPDLRARATRLDEGLAFLSGAWSGRPVDGGPMLPAARIPIWCAGRWPRRAGFRRAARWDGVVPTFAGYDQANPPPPDLLRAVVDLVGPGKDVAMEGASRDGSVVAPYAAAGLTWWLEAFTWRRGPLAEAFTRVAAGPPV
ncbi:LLM class flavin-dependent oxidoreductase [Rhizomonospora bruguierae]|uniref:LLM class flavin-dependent oxidoreductase n=1 Tax=Rhizomonospora bruguierae TaxID=1581705 RepID=UPI001BCD5477|nr:LLM class flavin-dependent oxidoreductase [Micromonospora sp. NBRC 107566]